MDASQLYLNKVMLNISTSKDQGLNLVKGEVLRGVVQDIRADGLISLFLKGQVIEAVSEVLVKPGQQLHLMVEDFREGRAYLKVLTPQLMEKIENTNLSVNLKDMGVPAKEANIMMARKLLQHNLPVTQNNLNMLSKAMNLLGGTNARNAEISAFALAKELPLTQPSLNALAQFLSSDNDMSKLAKSIFDSLAQLNRSAANETVSPNSTNQDNKPQINTNAVNQSQTSPGSSKNVLENAGYSRMSGEQAVQVKEAGGERIQVASTGKSAAEANTQISTRVSGGIATQAGEGMSAQLSRVGIKITAGDLAAANVKASGGQQAVQVNEGSSERIQPPPTGKAMEPDSASIVRVSGGPAVPAGEDELLPQLPRSGVKISAEELAAGIKKATVEQPVQSSEKSAPAQPAQMAVPGKGQVELILPNSERTHGGQTNQTVDKTVIQNTAEDNKNWLGKSGAGSESKLPELQASNSSRAGGSQSAPVNDKVPSPQIIPAKEGERPPDMANVRAERSGGELTAKSAELSTADANKSLNPNPAAKENPGVSGINQQEFNLPETRSIIRHMALLRPLLEIIQLNLEGNSQQAGEKMQNALLSEKDLIRGLVLLQDIIKNDSSPNKNPIISDLLNKIDGLERELSGQRIMNIVNRGSMDNAQNYYYFSFPVKIGDEYRLGQVRINREAGKRGLENQQHIRFIVSLDTAQMGMVLFHVDWNRNKELEIQGVVETQPVCSYLNENVDSLVQALNGLGYATSNLGIKVVNNPDEFKQMRMILEEVSPNIRPFGIDVTI